MREFASLGSFAAYLLERDVAVAVALEEGLKKAAEHVEKVAKDEFGEYQPAVGGFPAWAELADSTKAQRVALGYSENDPLLRSGELRDSIGHEVAGLEAVVGSTDDVMVYQELGTETIPPRPVLGPAAIRSEAVIQRMIGEAAVLGILGVSQLPAALGVSALERAESWRESVEGYSSATGL